MTQLVSSRSHRSLVLLIAAGLLWGCTRQADESNPAISIQSLKPKATRQYYRQTWAIAIGIDDYAFQPLHCAARDATEFAKLLCDEFQYRQDAVECLIDQEATKPRIHQALDELESKVKADDAVLVFFAGHGEMIEVDGKEEGFLASVDSSSRRPDDTWIPISWLRDRLSNLACSHRAVILDCCYSGGLFSRAPTIADEPTPADSDRTRDRSHTASRGEQHDAMTSTGLEYYLRRPAFLGLAAGRFTPVDDALKDQLHSPFTSSLLQAMRERTNSPREDHAFTFRELAASVETRVQLATNGLQIPVYGYLGPGDGDLVFLPSPAARRRTPREESDSRRRLAEVRRLADSSATCREEYPQRSMLLAVSSLDLSRRDQDPPDKIAVHCLFQSLSSVGGFPLGFGPRSSSDAISPHNWHTNIAISANGHWIATSCSSVASLWQLNAGNIEPPIILSGHTGWINQIGFTPDSETVITASRDATVRLWSVSSAAASTTPEVVSGHTDEILSASISPDGRWLATGSADRTARIWSLDKNRQPVARLACVAPHGGNVIELSFSPNSEWLLGRNYKTIEAAGRPQTFDEVVRLFRLKGYETVHEYVAKHKSQIRAAGFSPDSRWAITASDDGTLGMWDLAKENPSDSPAFLPSHLGGVRDLVLDGVGKHAVSLGRKGEACVWSLASRPDRDPHMFVRDDQRMILSGQLSRDGRWLVTKSIPHDLTPRRGQDLHSGVKLWDLNSKAREGWGQSLSVPGVGDADGKCVLFSSDGHWLVVGNGDGSVHLWNLIAERAPQGPAVLRGHNESVSALAITPDKSWLVTGSHDRTARLWDLRAKTIADHSILLRGHESAITSLTFSGNGRWLVSQADDHSVRLWDMWTFGSPAWPIKISERQSSSYLRATVSPGGRWLVKGQEMNSARLWDLSAKSAVDSSRTLRGESDVLHAAFSWDERWLVTGWRDGRILVWNLLSPDTNPLVLTGHTRGVATLVVSPDDRWVISTGFEDAGRCERCFWNLKAVKTGQALVTPKTVSDISYLDESFSPDGKWFVARGAIDGLLWDLSQATPELCPLKGQNELLEFVTFDQSSKQVFRAIRMRGSGTRDGVRIESARLVEGKGIVSPTTLLDMKTDTLGPALTKHLLPLGHVRALLVGREDSWLAANIDSVSLIRELHGSEQEGGWEEVRQVIYADVQDGVNDDQLFLQKDEDALWPLEHLIDMAGADAAARACRFWSAESHRGRLSQDGQWLITGTRVWRRQETGFSLWGDLPISEVDSAWFCPTANRLITSGWSDGVLLWDLGFDRLRDLARRAAGRDLSESELRDYGTERGFAGQEHEEQGSEN